MPEFSPQLFKIRIFVKFHRLLLFCMETKLWRKNHEQSFHPLSFLVQLQPFFIPCKLQTFLEFVWNEKCSIFWNLVLEFIFCPSRAMNCWPQLQMEFSAAAATEVVSAEELSSSERSVPRSRCRSSERRRTWSRRTWRHLRLWPSRRRSARGRRCRETEIQGLANRH